jgi:hypothetical protein
MTAALVLAVLIATRAEAQWLNYPTPGVPRGPDGKPVLSAPAPRSADGHPDLTGMWGDECMNGTQCFQEKNRFFDIERGLPPGTVQLTEWASAVQQQRLARNKIDDPYASCLPPGIPRMFFNNPFKIFVTPATTVFLHETAVGSTFRQVYTDGRPLPDIIEPTRLGYSVGRWDGDAFVVESAGFRDGLWLDTNMARPTSDALRITQRFTRRDFGHMDLAITLDDTKAFLKPFTITTHLVLRPDSDLLESFCDNQKNILPRLIIQPGAPEPPSPAIPSSSRRN